MANYIFTNALLSATGILNTPVPPTTALSADGVNIISLSSSHVGLVYNPTTTQTGTLANLTAFGSVLRIDTSYDGSTFALEFPDRRSYTVFQYSSAIATLPLSAQLSQSTREVSTRHQRRLRILGYL